MEDIRRAKEVVALLEAQIPLLRAQLYISSKRVGGTQATLELDIDAMTREIAETEGIEEENENLEKSLAAQRQKFENLQATLNGLQAKVVRKSATLHRLKETLAELQKYEDVSEFATKEDANVLSDLRSSISQRKRKISTLEARIADLKQVIDMKQRQMLTKTQKPRPHVIHMVEKLRVDHAVERENMRLIAMHEAEIKWLDELIGRARTEYGREMIAKMQAENSSLKESCKGLKQKFYGPRSIRDKQPLTNETQLAMMAARISELQAEQDGDRKKLAVSLSKIDKQLKLLKDYRIEAPPLPLAYQRVASTNRPRSSREEEPPA
jgi:chromosome segregation ATPase